MEVDEGEVVLEDDVVGAVGHFEAAQVVHVGLVPVGLSIVSVTEAAEQGEEACARTAQVVDSIGAAAAKVADGFVHAVRDIDGDEIVGAEAFGEFHGIALVGFDPVPGSGGDEGGGDDFAPHSHLQQPPCDPEAASARFVADVEIGEGAVVAFGDPTDGAFQDMLGGVDFPVKAGLRVAFVFEDGDGCFFFMHIKSEVECAWCVRVRFHLY